MFSKQNSAKAAAKTYGNGAKPRMPSIISESLTVNGNLESDGEIQVDGTVEGDIKTSELTVSEGATVRGAIDAETVSIAGNVTGQIKAKSVTFLSKARVIADVIQESLSIEPGAYFEGNARRMEAAKPDSTVAQLPNVQKKTVGVGVEPDADGPYSRSGTAD